MTDYEISGDVLRLRNFHVDAGHSGALGHSLPMSYLRDIVCGLCRHYECPSAALTPGRRRGGANPDGRIIGGSTPFTIQC